MIPLTPPRIEARRPSLFPITPYSQLPTSHASLQPPLSIPSSSNAQSHQPPYQGIPYSGFPTSSVNPLQMQSSLVACNSSHSCSWSSHPYENRSPGPGAVHHTGVSSGFITTSHVKVHISEVSLQIYVQPCHSQDH